MRIVVCDPGHGFDVMDVANPFDGDSLLKADGREIFVNESADGRSPLRR